MAKIKDGTIVWKSITIYEEALGEIYKLSTPGDKWRTEGNLSERMEKIAKIVNKALDDFGGSGRADPYDGYREGPDHD